MLAKLIVYISAAGASAAVIGEGRIGVPQRFASGVDGLAAFADFVSLHSSRAVLVVVDATEEDYRFETLPHASGSDRRQMVERKLRQYYRNTPFCAAELTGRDSAKRRDDRFLFCALTNPEVVTPWLNVISAAGQLIGGVFLLPLLMRRLVHEIAPGTANLLAVSVLPSGIRLTFYRDGAFRLSRLSRVDNAPEALARAIADEISNTRLYLNALRVATIDEPVSVVLIDHDNRLGEPTRQLCDEIQGASCTTLGPETIAGRLRLDPGIIATAPEVVYMQLLAGGERSCNLAPADMTLGYRRLRAGYSLYMASLAAGLAGLCWAGLNLSQQFLLGIEGEDALRRTASVNSEYEAVTRQFPSAPAGAEDLRRTTEIADRLIASERTPLPFLAALSGALAADPDLLAVELSWQYAAGEIGAGQVRDAAAAAAPAAIATGQRRQSGLVVGEIRNFRGDYRNAIERINRLAERLRKDPSVEAARVTQLPLNVSPGLSISGNASDAPAQGGSTDFRVIVIMKEGR